MTKTTRRPDKEDIDAIKETLDAKWFCILRRQRPEQCSLCWIADDTGPDCTRSSDGKPCIIVVIYGVHCFEAHKFGFPGYVRTRGEKTKMKYAKMVTVNLIEMLRGNDKKKYMGKYNNIVKRYNI